MDAPLSGSPSPAALVEKLVGNVALALEGKRDVVELAVVALLAGGHLLIEDAPGVGKTTLARSLARSLGVGFRRVQFTSDLMPADLLGGSVYDPQRATFEFRPGPIFTNVLVADEINRTTPKTQSALLEAMAERQISLDGTTRALEPPFFVVATQNPEELYGTYPLPESQLDRFLLRIRIGYAPEGVERELLRSRRGREPSDLIEPVLSRDDLRRLEAAVDGMRVDDLVVDYLHAIVLATRRSTLLEVGASTRAALAFERASRAFALVRGRAYVSPDDVKALAGPVLAHRVRVAGAADPAGERVLAERVVREILSQLPVPV